MGRLKNSPTTKLDMRSIEARKKWMQHWREVADRASPEYLEPSMVKRSLKSWQGVARSVLRPPKQTQKHTGAGQHS
ncbi:MAG: hypothetical protein H6Q52_2745 [Deltaproteobacteria bacterium]|nr:hypothetical protein [Deltaproteobacteria bacterium]